MARHIFYVFFLLFFLMENTAGSVNLDVHPTDINPGLTQSLTVNCSFTFAQASNISGIISLILSKMVLEANKTGQFQDLISINTFSPDQINVISPVNGSMLGHISNDGESFLTIQWTYPGNDQTGLYRCEAHGMDSTGHPSEVAKTAVVTSEQPNMVQLIDKVSDLQRQLDRQQEVERNQSQSIDYLTSQLDRQQVIERNQSQSIDYLTSQLDRHQVIERNQSQSIDYLTSQLDRQEKIIDTLLSLTKNQSDMINQINKQQSQLDLMKYADIFHVSSIYNNHVYLLSKADWKDATVADQTCKDYNGYLAQIDNPGEDTFINQFLDSTSGFSDLLVSGTDERHDGRWTYTGTDIDMTYINWSPTEPDYSGNNCIYKSRGYQWQFRDHPCSYTNTGTPKKFLCEVNLQ